MLVFMQDPSRSGDVTGGAQADDLASRDALGLTAATQSVIDNPADPYVLRVSTGVSGGEPVLTGLTAEARPGCDAVPLAGIHQRYRRRLSGLVREIAAATAWQVHRGDGYVAYVLAAEVPTRGAIHDTEVLHQLRPRRGRPAGTGVDRGEVHSTLQAAGLDLSAPVPEIVATLAKARMWVSRSTIYRLRREAQC